MNPKPATSEPYNAFRFKPHLRISQNTPTRFTISDGFTFHWAVDGKPWLAKLFTRLQHFATETELCRQLAQSATAREIRAAITSFSEAGWLEVQASLPATLPIRQAYLMRWPHADTNALEQTILILGKGPLTDRIHADLTTLDIPTTSAEPHALTLTPHQPVALCIAVESELPRRDDLDPLDTIDANCHTANTPWLRIACDAHAISLGPLFLAQETACYNCLPHRLNSNRQYPSLNDPPQTTPLTNPAAAAATIPPFIHAHAAALAVAETIRFLTRNEAPRCLGKLIHINIHSLETEAQSLLRIPGCPRCATPAPTTPSVRPASKPATTRIEPVLGQRCGIVASLIPIYPTRDDPQIQMFAARSARLRPLNARGNVVHGGGASLNPESARLAAVGELVERYCAHFVQTERLYRARWQDFNNTDALDPENLPLYSTAQYKRPGFPFQPFRRNTQTNWIQGLELTPKHPTGVHPCWLPADAVFLTPPDNAQTPPIVAGTSNGLAAGPSPEFALYAAICECIERDALLIAWKNRLRAPRLDLANPHLAWLRKFLEAHFLYPRIDYRIADLTSNLRVPVYAVIASGPSDDGPIHAFGAAAHPNAQTALKRALLEAALTRVYIRQLIRENPNRRYYADATDVVSFPDHAQFYTREPRRLPDLHHLVSDHLHAPLDPFDQHTTTPVTTALEQGIPPESDTDTATSSPKSELATLLAQLATAGFRAYAASLTTPDVAEHGWHVVRAIIPGLQSIHADHRLPLSGGTRAAQPQTVFNWAAPPNRAPYVPPHPYP